MTSYVRARAREWSTWIGLALLVLILAHVVYQHHVEIEHVAAGLVSAMLVAVRETAARRIMAALRPLKSPPDVQPAHKVTVMTSSAWSSIEAAMIAAGKAELAKLVTTLPPKFQAIYADAEDEIANPSALNTLKLLGDIFAEVQVLVAPPLQQLGTTSSQLGSLGATP